ncbi:type II toxin-antitoxin system VapC family toxin [Laspinema olomoucense]|uniref:Type II toxin-antitoxin system VapC family toxin n=1 Tax=Laspinema olomoucense D3b TaxID=2953688 RepID=A0ABT2N3W7_9CYAN|nr:MULTISPECIES: type II toxin-antitoxin system VapC family toxin [unclassified Laspinema]MCT7977380.1 type II toxin-antitoxin system VapC family toxin [Laspinema sp. D3b]MCT7986799.1 type II toxin-antitoxin system VapC family toxin [Laspinema sp. D3a]
MNLLLDTHTFMWWSLTPERLSERVSSLLADPSNDLILSVASVWEMQIKLQLGKLNLELPLRELIETQQQTNNLQLLPIEVTHVWALENLPIPHKDPFDRILIAQATVEQQTLLSIDAIFDAYPVNRVW